MASTTEPEPSPKDEQKVPLAIESAVYWTKVLDYAFKDNKKWILQAAEPSPKSIIFSSMFNNKENSDVTFKVGDKEYHLHRAYVGEWSPIFKKMFLEKESETHQVIELKTSSAHSSRMYDNMFRFMYFDYISVPTSDFLPMLALACKYQIQALVAECSNMAPELIKLKQALSLVEQVHKHYTPEMQPLVDKCNEMICHEFERVYKKGSWFRLSKEALLGILDRNDVCADEYEVFEAVKKWCAHSEDRSAYLDELLTHVRFPTMDPKKIALLDKDPIFSKSKVLEGFQLEALKYCANPAIAKKSANPKKFESRWYASVEETFKYDPANEVIKTYVVPANGYYRFVAKGAKALDGTNKKGGRGAIIEATFFLKRGDKLEILVGGMSKRRSSDTGGGGGTFVAINGRKNPLIVAGGGGGTRGSTGDQDGRDASLTPDGTDGAGTYCSKGATGGQGATGCTSSYGGGGGGFLSDGKPNGSGTTPGIGFINGGKSTPYGGFGGGGDAGNSGGGGGGGYSGGGAGQGAGGGGSFVREDGGDVEKAVGWKSHGYLTIVSARKPKAPGKKLGT